jgi:hypothetical protein
VSFGSGDVYSMRIIYAEGVWVAIEIKTSIYIIDLDNLSVYDQNGKRLLVTNVDSWLHQSTMWSFGLTDLKIFIEHFNAGRRSVIEADIHTMLANFVVHIYESGYAADINKFYDIEQLDFNTIDKKIIPSLRDNFDAIKNENGNLSMELFLTRLKKRLKCISPIHAKIIDSLLGRLGNEFADVNMQAPEALAIAIQTFLDKIETYKLSKEALSIKATLNTLKMKNIAAVLS